MSTTPPSPLGSGFPSQGTPRAQRAAVRAQARWQRDQAQAQARIQMQSLRRTSAVGPVLLVALGIVFLLGESGRLLPVAALLWFSIWWPAVLIGAGAILLTEWALDRQGHGVGSALAPRRTLGGLTATALFLIAAVGVGLTAVRHSFLGQENWQKTWDQAELGRQMDLHGFSGWQELFGQPQDFTEDLQASLSPSGELTVEDPHGDVTVTGSSDDGQVHVSVHQHLLVLGRDDPGRRHLQEQPRFHGDRDHLTLTALPHGEDDADLTITVPHDANLVVRGGTGDISVEEIHGLTSVSNQSGDVKLTALRGPVHLNSASEDTTITAHSLGRGLDLEGRSGDIALSDIEGGAVLHGDFFGTTQMERIRGQVHFQSSFTRLDCAGISGSLVVEGRSDLTAHRLDGPLTLTTSDRNLAIDDVRGPTVISDRNGSVDFTLSAPLQPLQISNANGAISISVPDHQGFVVQAQATEGQIQNDLGLVPTGTGTTQSVKGKILGGGPLVSLQTTNEDIKLSRVAHPTSSSDDGGSASWVTPDPRLQVRHRDRHEPSVE